MPHALPDPFIVIATQNPIEYEGTYPLPEAQLDRFCMKLDVGYPQPADEEAIAAHAPFGCEPVDARRRRRGGDRRGHDVAARAEVDAVTVSDAMVGYVAAIVRRTRELPSVLLGASPRAGVHLLALSKAAAALAGRAYVVPDDVRTGATRFSGTACCSPPKRSSTGSGRRTHCARRFRASRTSVSPTRRAGLALGLLAVVALALQDAWGIAVVSRRGAW